MYRHSEGPSTFLLECAEHIFSALLICELTRIVMMDRKATHSLNEVASIEWDSGAVAGRAYSNWSLARLRVHIWLISR